MNRISSFPTLETVKLRARRLRAELTAAGTAIGHGRSLELMAHMHGYKDWNTFRAALATRPSGAPVLPGQRVSGRYLGHSFEGEVTGVQDLAKSGKYRVTCQFDRPVDVVAFEGMSNLRRRVTCVIGGDGTTVEKTSNGQPHLSLDL